MAMPESDDRPGDGAAPPPSDGPPADLLQFPTDFPIKVMGRREDAFVAEITAVVRRHAPDFDIATIEIRSSSKGNYLGLTATIRARSREQLDALYRELTAHPLVKIVL
jgi:putative lipoic acid-binding regulatory protein